MIWDRFNKYIAIDPKTNKEMSIWKSDYPYLTYIIAPANTNPLKGNQKKNIYKSSSFAKVFAYFCVRYNFDPNKLEQDDAKNIKQINIELVKAFIFVRYKDFLINGIFNKRTNAIDKRITKTLVYEEFVKEFGEERLSGVSAMVFFSSFAKVVRDLRKKLRDEKDKKGYFIVSGIWDDDKETNQIKNQFELSKTYKGGYELTKDPDKIRRYIETIYESGLSTISYAEWLAKRFNVTLSHQNTKDSSNFKANNTNNDNEKWQTKDSTKKIESKEIVLPKANKKQSLGELLLKFFKIKK